jgi:histidinol phosphatase-like enzyme
MVLLRGAGYDLFVVSNQIGVAKGLLTEDEQKLIRRRMCKELVNTGAAITKA